MVSKQMMVLKDSSMEEILDFLNKAEKAGENIPTVIGPQVQLDPSDDLDSLDMASRTVAFEARQLKMLFLSFD